MSHRIFRTAARFQIAAQPPPAPQACQISGPIARIVFTSMARVGLEGATPSEQEDHVPTRNIRFGYGASFAFG